MVDRKNEGKAKRFTDQRRLTYQGWLRERHSTCMPYEDLFSILLSNSIFTEDSSGLDFDKKGAKTRGATVK